VLICVYECFVCMYACISEEGIRFHYRWLWATMYWLLGFELRASLAYRGCSKMVAGALGQGWLSCFVHISTSLGSSLKWHHLFSLQSAWPLHSTVSLVLSWIFYLCFKCYPFPGFPSANIPSPLSLLLWGCSPTLLCSLWHTYPSFSVDSATEVCKHVQNAYSSSSPTFGSAWSTCSSPANFCNDHSPWGSLPPNFFLPTLCSFIIFTVHKAGTRHLRATGLIVTSPCTHS